MGKFVLVLTLCSVLQNPVSFALNLAVPADKVLKTKHSFSTKGSGEGLKETGGQGDEANTERTQVPGISLIPCTCKIVDIYNLENQIKSWRIFASRRHV